MATYNGAKYIREQIDSIFNQTIQDFELIICDDSSKDETLEILYDYAKKDQRVKVYENENNLGFKKNFEKVLTLCNGDYIALSDQDDIWYPQHLELLLKAMSGNIQLACGRPIFVNEDNMNLPSKYDYFKMDWVPDNDMDLARHIFLCRSTFQGASMMIRHSFLDIALPLPNGVKFHDSWFAALSCFAGGMVFIDKPMMRYRRYGSAITSESRKQSPVRIFLGALIVNHSLKDRIVFIRAIRNRISHFSPEQLDLLGTLEKLLERRKTIWGRIKNVPYLIKHFRAIYCYDGKHLFTI